MSFDPQEIERFERLAEEWWDPTGRFRPLHQINPLRIDYIVAHAGSVQQKRVLDVGCGGGLLAEALAKQGAEVDGIDRSEKALFVARKHAEQSGVENLRYACADAESWAKTHAHAYDIVCCMELLEHVPDPVSTIAACASMLKPGGLWFFSTINRTPKAFFLAIVGAEYILRWLPRGTHRYEKLLRPSEVDAACKRAGLKPVDLVGISFSILQASFVLSSDLSVNYMGCARKDSA